MGNPFRLLVGIICVLFIRKGVCFIPNTVSFCRKSLNFATTVPETSPLSPTTFAGMVEEGIRERFGDKTDRVIESWRLLDRDYEHKEFVGGPDKDENSSNCHQLAHSFVPGLTAKSFWDESEYRWAKKLKSKYKSIRREFEAVTADMAKLQSEGNNIWAGALTDDASSYGVGWKTLVLMNRGRWDEVNANLFPVTSKAIHDCGVPVVEVFFASMQPNSDIKMHSDFTNFVLTSHLALDIPYSGEHKCRLTIGDDTREWKNGEVMLFDTSIMHDAVNESDKTRYILMMRIWHPDLTEDERDALQFTFDCLEVPELLSSDPDERLQAQKAVIESREFPSKKSTQGFGPPKGKRSKRIRGVSSAGKGFS